DFALLAEIADDYDSPLATGENLFSTQDVENLVRFGGLRPDRNDVIQVDPPQAYGIVQYARTVAMVERRGWPRTALFPHGGNQMSLALPAVSVSAARNPIPAYSAPSAVSPMTPNCSTAISRCPIGRASASRANRRFTQSCARLRRDQQPSRG